MKKIELTQGQYALVDDEDYGYLMQWKWCAHRRDKKYTFYAIRTIYPEKQTLRMHNVIAGRYIKKDYEELDHIDRNGLNNQKSNLKAGTRGGNQHNTRNWGKFPKGVHKHIKKYKLKSGKIKEYVTFRSRINVDGKEIYLGGYKTVEKAVDAYAKASEKYYPNCI